MVSKVSKTGIALIVFILSVPALGEARTLYYSFFSDEPEKYLVPIERQKQATSLGSCIDGSLDVRAGIVTHHFLAVDLMTEFFDCLSKRLEPQRVVLIGPDHYGQSIKGISVSSLPWKTPFGELTVDEGIVGKINESLELSNDTEAFSGEHSIGILVPFIRYYFPKSKIVPIIIQRNIAVDKLVVLKNLFDHFLDDPKTLILLSMDFSHNQTAAEADLRDEMARSVINNMDYRKTDKLDIDCHPGLKVLLAALQERRNIRPKVLNHSNSARLTGQANLSNVTSYFTILFYESPDGTKQMGTSE